MKHFTLALILASLSWVKSAPAPVLQPAAYDYYSWPCGNFQQGQWTPQLNIDPCQQQLDYPGYWNGQIFPDCCYQGCYPRDCSPPYPAQPPPPAPAPAPVPQCPYHVSGWNTILGKTVYLSQTMDGLSWFAADAKSLELGARLLKIKSANDNLLFEAIRPCYPSGTKVWIGGNDLARQGSWVWSDGSPITGYTNFASTIEHHGRCLAASVDSPEWRKSKCHGRQHAHIFISEKVTDVSEDAGESTTQKPVITSTRPPTVSSTARPPFSTARPLFSTTPGFIYSPTPSRK